MDGRVFDGTLEGPLEERILGDAPEGTKFWNSSIDLYELAIPKYSKAFSSSLIFDLSFNIFSYWDLLIDLIYIILFSFLLNLSINNFNVFDLNLIIITTELL